MTDQQTIRIMCPKLTCRRILAVPPTARGRTVRCRGCGSTVKIPANSQPATPQQSQPPTPEEGRTAPAESTRG